MLGAEGWFKMLGIDLISKNLMSIENIILLVVLLGSIIFYAKDFKLGLLLDFVFSALCFVWFYIAGLNYVYALVCTCIFLVLLSFSLYFVRQTANRGVIG